jgi:hypothetical protein
MFKGDVLGFGSRCRLIDKLEEQIFDVMRKVGKVLRGIRIII